MSAFALGHGCLRCAFSWRCVCICDFDRVVYCETILFWLDVMKRMEEQKMKVNMGSVHGMSYVKVNDKQWYGKMKVAPKDKVGKITAQEIVDMS